MAERRGQPRTGWRMIHYTRYVGSHATERKVDGRRPTSGKMTNVNARKTRAGRHSLHRMGFMDTESCRHKRGNRSNRRSMMKKHDKRCVHTQRFWHNEATANQKSLNVLLGLDFSTCCSYCVAAFFVLIRDRNQPVMTKLVKLIRSVSGHLHSLSVYTMNERKSCAWQRQRGLACQSSTATERTSGPSLRQCLGT